VEVTRSLWGRLRGPRRDVCWLRIFSLMHGVRSELRRSGGLFVGIGFDYGAIFACSLVAQGRSQLDRSGGSAAGKL